MMNVHVYPSEMTHESRILKETAALRDWGLFEKIVLAGIGGAHLPDLELLDETRTIWRVPRGKVQGIVGKTLAMAGWSSRVYRMLCRESLECINCHSLSVLPLCVALKYRTGARLIYDAHELETEASSVRGIRRALAKLVERALIGRVDAIIVVGNAIADWYVKTYRCVRPAVVLNCPSRRPAPISNRLRETLGLREADTLFLYQGVISPGRGIDIVIDAFESLGDPAVVLVFMGNGPLEDQVKAAAARCDRIRYLRAVPPQDLANYTASADFGLCLIEPRCLSYQYCMPNKLFEYLAAGLPVVVTDLTEIGPIVRDGAAGQVVPAMPSRTDLHRAIRSLVQADRRRLRDNVMALASRYTWEDQLSTLRAVYAQVLAL